MCGILGYVGLQTGLEPERWTAAQSVQAHRGPDDRGEYTSRVGGSILALAQQRLAIVDLSAAGHQPMSGAEGEGVIVFNGELYNYRELREELRSYGRRFATNTDTEVVLKALAEWGPAEAAARFNGMWAFAWYDSIRRCLWLSRDRFGEKPLYWHRSGSGLYFASEIKALLELVPQRFRLNLDAVGRYLLQSLADTGDGSFFQGIEQLPAGTLAKVEVGRAIEAPAPAHFWTAPADVAVQPPEELLVQRLRDLLVDSVGRQLEADVPVGVLLSGGLDSSTLAAAARRQLPSEELTLLSAVSDDPRFDESPFIDRVARHLGCGVRKVRLDLSGQQAFELLDEVTWYNDSPVGSFSNVAHYLLMQKAQEQGVKVVLSGQGADELLCGYRKYLGFYVQSLLRQNRPLEAVRVLGAFAANGTVLRQFNWAEAKRYLPAPLRRQPTESLAGEALAHFRPEFLGLARGQTLQQRQLADLQRYSVPSLTHFEDRMSMAHSREVRLPFLDYRLAEMLLGLPPSQKLRRGWTKYILRRAVEPWLPPDVVWRRDKQGFTNPEGEWLKREFAPQVLQYLASDALIFRYRLVNRDQLMARYRVFRQQAHGRGRVWFREIFAPLALEAWLRRFEDRIAAP